MTATSTNPLLSTAPSAAPGGSPLVTDLAALTRPDFPCSTRRPAWGSR